MPPDCPEAGSAEDWLQHARSDLALCREAHTEEVLRETLCFHAQQAAEKAIKAVLVARGIAFPRTHNLLTLAEVLASVVAIPAAVRESAALTGYAVASRYPGEEEPVSDEELHCAVALAARVVEWAQTECRGARKESTWHAK